MRGLTATLATLAAAGGLIACGSGAPSRPVSGATVFAQECSVCHSLIGNESLHRPGGDLIGYSLTRPQLLAQTRQMPVKRPLSPVQLAAVVQYVWTVQHQKRAR